MAIRDDYAHWAAPRDRRITGMCTCGLSSGQKGAKRRNGILAGSHLTLTFRTLGGEPIQRTAPDGGLIALDYVHAWLCHAR